MKMYEKTSSLDDLIEKTLDSIKAVSSTKTIFGDPIKLSDGTEIVPVSKVTIGAVVGGGEYSDLSTRRVATHYPMAGGSGCGIVLNPIGFILSTNSEVKYISTTNKEYERIFEIFNYIGKKVDSYIKKKEKDNVNRQR